MRYAASGSVMLSRIWFPEGEIGRGPIMETLMHCPEWANASFAGLQWRRA